MIELKTEKKNAKETLLHSGIGQWKQIILVRILRDAGFNSKSKFTYSISYFIVNTHSVGTRRINFIHL